MTLVRSALLVLVLLAVLTMPACAAVAGIFKAGMGVGIFLAVIVIGLVFFVVSRVRA